MLLDEIIDATVDEKVPIGTLLRKCLVLDWITSWTVTTRLRNFLRIGFSTV